MNETRRGHFASKHPSGTSADPNVKAMLESRFVDGCIACAAAHEIAGALNVGPGTVGQTIDLLEGRIEKCQLGLFGYGPRKKIARSDHPIAPDLREAVVGAQQDGRLACAEAWAISARLSVPRLTIGSACETLGIKVVRCQLGAF